MTDCVYEAKLVTAYLGPFEVDDLIEDNSFKYSGKDAQKRDRAIVGYV